jgi:hypothetical protein
MLLDLKSSLLAHGLTQQYLANKLRLLLDARMPKWNPDTEDWDIFEDSGTQAEALRMAYQLHDAFPAKKEPPPAAGPVTVIFDTDITIHEQEIYAAGKVIEQGSVPNQPQGNAGSGASAEASAGSRLLDAAQGTNEE